MDSSLTFALFIKEREIYQHVPCLWSRLVAENVPHILYAAKSLIRALSLNILNRFFPRIWDLLFLVEATKITIKSCMVLLKSSVERPLSNRFEGKITPLQREI